MNNDKEKEPKFNWRGKKVSYFIPAFIYMFITMSLFLAMVYIGIQITIKYGSLIGIAFIVLSVSLYLSALMKRVLIIKKFRVYKDSKNKILKAFYELEYEIEEYSLRYREYDERIKNNK